MNRREYNIAVKLHASNLYGYVFGFLRNSEDTQDIVQDVFEKLWKNRKKVEVEKCKAWMFRTGHNALINFSKRKNRTVYNTELVPEKSKIDNRFETQEIIDLALSLLPPTQKSIVLLRDLEGYSYNEISEILDLSDSQVKVYLYRARKKIKKQLGDLILTQ
ncbi:RNA polymerase sigma factor [Brumimicrobium salinarum]|uniref:RNA polymerase sigma factor n=1 Tax=Brumimicrobium salinarum TaxID=2058658 RepID=A0A2I0R004_9FLAO|nr:RNA polymerase sigma factor [Brumimicrobium salinarum]PKR79924.1 RNA polymerase sigma factor [Brumimicrobium salinarum]